MARALTLLGLGAAGYLLYRWATTPALADGIATGDATWIDNNATIDPAFPAQAAGTVTQIIANVANAVGIPSAYLLTLARKESALNPNAKNPNSTAAGLFQFIASTAARYGLTDPFDPQAAAVAAAQLTLDNQTYLQNALGRSPTPGELYVAHFLGPAGARKLLTANPAANAVALFPIAALSNPSIFGTIAHPRTVAAVIATLEAGF